MHFTKYFLIILFHFVHFCNCFEVISSTLGVIGTVAGGAIYAAWSSTQESCSDKWIKFNYSGLVSTFKRSLHGQHLAERVIVKLLKGHLENKNPSKPLVMAFHGTTGSGKNYVSHMIANHLFQKGIESQFVHYYYGTADFPHESEVEEYKDKLLREVKQYTRLCPRSLFVFDEIDKMPSGVLDSIKNYLDYNTQIEDIDFSKNIFIFLSNAGGTEILKLGLKFWMDGKERSKISMMDIEPIINKGAFNEKGGLKGSNLIARHLIDVYIPFLPLERQHVELCVRDILRSKFMYLDEKLISRISDQVEYFPHDLKLFSESGCKRLQQKVDIYAD